MFKESSLLVTGVAIVAQNRFHTRQAAAALLKMAQATSDPSMAARLVEAAADLQEQAGELPPPTSPKAPDIQIESGEKVCEYP